MSAVKAQVVEVVPGLYRLVDLRSVNAYVWRPRSEGRAEAEPILFDCGWPWSGRVLVSSLAALACRPTEIKKIAITHADLDHAGRLASLQAVSGAEVIAHPAEAERLGQDAWRPTPENRWWTKIVASVSAMYATRWPRHHVRATRLVQDGDEIGNGWIAVATPGHTPGHTSYFHPGLRTLIAGDALGSIRKGRIRAAAHLHRGLRGCGAFGPQTSRAGTRDHLFRPRTGVVQSRRAFAQAGRVFSG